MQNNNNNHNNNSDQELFIDAILSRVLHMIMIIAFRPWWQDQIPVKQSMLFVENAGERSLSKKSALQ